MAEPYGRSRLYVDSMYISRVGTLSLDGLVYTVYRAVLPPTTFVLLSLWVVPCTPLNSYGLSEPKIEVR